MVAAGPVLSLLLLHVLLFFSGVCGVHTVENAETRAVVRNCAGLRSAVEDTNVGVIVISGRIRCSRAEWESPILVTRNLSIMGANDPGELSMIDWGALTKVLIAWGPGVILRLHRLAILQDDMGITGVDLAFMGARHGAHLSMSQCVVNVKYCVTPVSVLAPSLMERPGFAPGGQTAKGIESEGMLRIADVVLYWPGLDAVWTLCQSSFVCGLRSARSLRKCMGLDEVDVQCFWNG